jgi:hypothetical protein
MQINITLRFYLTPVRMAIMKNINENKCCSTTFVVLKKWKTMWRLLKKLRIELPYEPAIPLLGIPEGM